MPRRNLVFANNEIYHIYNRSIAKEQIFVNKIHLKKILEVIEYYLLPERLSLSRFKQLSEELKGYYLDELKNKSPLLEIYSYSIMPNHYHILAKQLEENGIIRFISNIQNSYAKYYNLKNNRDGSLFKNQFKAKRIESEEQFIHVSRYIHLNHVTAFLIPYAKLATFPWTSYSVYVDENIKSFVQTKYILSMFSSLTKYKEFVTDQIDYQRNLSLIKHMLFDE